MQEIDRQVDFYLETSLIIGDFDENAVEFRSTLRSISIDFSGVQDFLPCHFISSFLSNELGLPSL